MTKFSIQKLYTIAFLAIMIPVAIQAQSFHYDTVPNPNRNQRRLFSYEVPNRHPVATQQKQNLPAPPASATRSGFDKRNLVFGGGLGLSFGNDYTSFIIAPQVGYRFNNYFTAGAGISYSYYSFNNWSQNYLGANIYARVTPISYIALQIQPEIYKMWAGDRFNNTISKTVPCLLVGGGAILPTGRNSAVSMMLYYDLVQNEYSPYFNRLVYSIGYIFSF